MKLSIHYYILSLNNETSKLFEGFRDELIDIHNMGFPYHFPVGVGIAAESNSQDARIRESLITTDQRFDQYYEQDPLRLVIVGDNNSLAVFQSLTMHGEVILGRVEGDYTSTSPRDLGKIVWPVVMDAMAGKMENAMYDLEEATVRKDIAIGIDEVALAVETESPSTLFVEEDYHAKGSMSNSEQSLLLTKYVDLWEVFNDVVDIIIEKVLETDGNVIFMDSGSLIKYQRIALVPNMKTKINSRAGARERGKIPASS